MEIHKTNKFIGIYAILDKETEQILYVGMSKDYHQRILNHKNISFKFTTRR